MVPNRVGAVLGANFARQNPNLPGLEIAFPGTEKTGFEASTGHFDAIFAIFGAGFSPLAGDDLEISDSGDKNFLDLWGHQNPIMAVFSRRKMGIAPDQG